MSKLGQVFCKAAIVGEVRLEGVARVHWFRAVWGGHMPAIEKSIKIGYYFIFYVIIISKYTGGGVGRISWPGSPDAGGGHM